MKRSSFYLSLVGALVAGTAATAGGYIAPIVEAPIDIVEPAAPLTWKGAYVGGTLGYAFGGDDEVGSSYNDSLFASPDTLELSGMNGGLRIGYRTQFTGRTRDWVIGAEFGYEGGNIEDSFSTSEVRNVAGVPDTQDFTAKSSINSVMALRVKTGVLNQAQNTLFYGILGVAQADIDYSVTGEYDVYKGAADPEIYEIKGDGETMTGYIVGLGVERRLNERLSVTGEWEYANFGKETLKNDYGYSTEMTPDFHNIKVGLNYQF